MLKSTTPRWAKGAAFELDGFSEDLLFATRIITLSDLATALGMFLQEHLKASCASNG